MGLVGLENRLMGFYFKVIKLRSGIATFDVNASLPDVCSPGISFLDQLKYVLVLLRICHPWQMRV